MASLEDLMNAIASDPESVTFNRAALQPGWSMTPNVDESMRSIPTTRPPQEVGGFDRFMLGSGSQYLTPEERTDARWYGVLSALGSLPQRGLLGAIPAGMEAGRSAVGYEQAQRTSRDWQGYTGDEATRAVQRGDDVGFERWASAFYGKPGQLPKAQYPPHVVRPETIGTTPTGEPINQDKMVVYDPRVGRYVAKNIPGLGPRTLGSRDFRMLSPEAELRQKVRDSEIEAARREVRKRQKQGLYSKDRFNSTADEAKLIDASRKRKSTESEGEHTDWTESHPVILPGASGVSQPGPLGEEPEAPATRARPRTAQEKAADALEKLRKQYLE